MWPCANFARFPGAKTVGLCSVGRFVVVFVILSGVALAGEACAEGDVLVVVAIRSDGSTVQRADSA
jgi:hypothetical protein